MKIYYDENMPYAAEFFGEFGELTAFNGRELSADTLIDAEVLLVRSITQVNEKLLSNSPQIKFVGTATIGVDHIDQTYLFDKQINFSSAPGCNAISVAEYVLSTLIVLAERYCFSVFDKTVGIVGAGNTGSRLSEKLTALGIQHKLYDPILAATGEDSRIFASFEDILKCDIISLHVPKTTTGLYPTYHMFDQTVLSSLTEDQILINACRGEVIDNQALLLLKQHGMATKLVLDVWENEPKIAEALIPFCEISTAHIAGYSLEGKARGTEMLYLALCEQLNKKPIQSLEGLLPKSTISQVELHGRLNDVILNQLVKMVYDVRRDDGIFRQQVYINGFDYIRKTYPARREFSATKVVINDQQSETQVLALGFS
ncbi:4-phosphoerythronate dehydrogenase [Thalassotalea hakodatensis]|uniref:4-phosphoerythronate dehydrogenase n=1 Tax=Thalassotalea hakodatensis TaxID=3030492 RepID=UPI00257476C4|nr:4-phosphoerythronate dehydrogenase [Thalassotalea hakodatensis]